MNTTGLTKNLLAQVAKLTRHNRQGSYKTRRRYNEAMLRFCAFLAEKYRLQNLRNISRKHVEAYVEHMQEEGKSASTIKTDLSAIRFYHDLIPDARYRLPDNKELSLEKRKIGGVVRRWSPDEFARFLQVCERDSHVDYIHIATLAHYAGLRIHECYRLDTAAAEAALRTGELTFKGKGGKIRTVPLCNEALAALLAAKEGVARGHKLFVRPDEDTHIAIHRLEEYIRQVRSEVADPDRESNLTFHGLRHSFAAGEFSQQIAGGASELAARRAVSHLMGHERPDITKIYLASVGV